MTKVVLSPLNAPAEEFATLKFPSVPVEITSRVPMGFPSCAKVIEADVVKIRKPASVGGNTEVVVEAVTVTACVEAFALLSLIPA